MNRKARACLSVLTLFIFPWATCVPAPEPELEMADTRAEDEAAIRALRDAFSDSQRAGDAERNASFYADDAIVMHPGAPSDVGIDAIRSGLAGFFDDSEWSTQEPIKKLQVMGDWAFTRTSWSGSQTDKATGTAVPLSGKAVHIYRRQLDGSWKIAIDIYNFDHPVDPS